MSVQILPQETGATTGGPLSVFAYDLYAGKSPVSLDSKPTFLLRPVGPLINGSQGQDLEIGVPLRDVQKASEVPALNGIPLGQYQVYAAVTLPNDPQLYRVYVRIRTVSGPFTESLSARFSDSGRGSGDVSCLSTPRLNLELSLTPGG